MYIYGILNTTLQENSKKELPIENGRILMAEPKPTPDHIAQADGTWIIPFDKRKLVDAAYEVQNDYLDFNFMLLIRDRIYQDNTNYPKTKSYIDFLKALWAEYTIRKENQTPDYDFTQFAPETVYSYKEVFEELNT